MSPTDRNRSPADDPEQRLDAYNAARRAAGLDDSPPATMAGLLVGAAARAAREEAEGAL